MTNKTRDKLAALSPAELARFDEFRASHPLREFSWKSRRLTYIAAGKGGRKVLIPAGGWGGPELLYETILGLEGENRVLAVDVSGLDEPEDMAAALDRILEEEGGGRVTLVGQSLSGILAQVYFHVNPSRVEAMVLINTLAPRPERSKKWALALLRVLPLGLFRLMAGKSLAKLSRYEAQVTPEIEERLRFKAAFTADIFKSTLTRERLLSVLKLSFRLNERGAYAAEELAGWDGRLHVITSRDDPYYPDIELFRKAFPRFSLFELPQGYGHIAPQVYRDEFFAEIRRFIAGREA